MILDLHNIVKLSDSEEDVAIMRFEKKMSTGAIAGHLDVTEACVRLKLYRVMIKLKRLVEGHPEHAQELQAYHNLQHDMRLQAAHERYSQ